MFLLRLLRTESLCNKLTQDKTLIILRDLELDGVVDGDPRRHPLGVGLDPDAKSLTFLISRARVIAETGRGTPLRNTWAALGVTKHRLDRHLGLDAVLEPIFLLGFLFALCSWTLLVSSFVL